MYPAHLTSAAEEKQIGAAFSFNVLQIYTCIYTEVLPRYRGNVYLKAKQLICNRYVHPYQK